MIPVKAALRITEVDPRILLHGLAGSMNEPLLPSSPAVPSLAFDACRSGCLANATSLNVPVKMWRAARSEARVTVLGTSVTSGCGACSAWNVTSTQQRVVSADPRCVGLPILRCAYPVSWAAQFSQHLTRHVQLPVRMSIVGKNAVGPSFFMKCTSSIVPRDANIVLLDVSTNLWGGPTIASDLLRSVQRAAPNAAVAFVAWPRHESLASVLRGTDSALRQVMAAGGGSKLSFSGVSGLADVLDMGRVLQAVAGGTASRFYADKIHPNSLGHRLMAEAAARFVASRLAPGCVQSDGSDTLSGETYGQCHAKGAHDQSAAFAAVGDGRRGAAAAPTVALRPAAMIEDGQWSGERWRRGDPWERCINRADRARGGLGTRALASRQTRAHGRLQA